MKRNTKLFFKSFYLSSVIVLCLLIGVLGIMKAYEGIRLIGFGEYRNAIEIDNGKFNFFDYTLNLPEF